MSISAITNNLGLTGNEERIFSYLATLYYYGKDWEGPMDRLGKQKGISHQTVGRIIESLTQKQLISKAGQKIQIINQQVQDLIGRKEVENGHVNAQYGQNKVYDGQNSQEKEKNQKNKEEIKDKIKDNNSSLLKDVMSQPRQPLCFNSFIPPTWEDIVLFAQEKRMPLPLYKKFYAYYSANGWTLKGGKQMSNWKAALTYWWETEQTRSAQVGNRGQFGHATEQEQASYAGSEYTAYLARTERKRQEELEREQNVETRCVTFEEFKQMAG